MPLHSCGGADAWQALFDQAGLSKGQKLLIHGAAGGVGSVAVQLAKWKGALSSYCVGEESGSSTGIGVDEPIDYEKTRFEDIVHDVDVVLDTLGGDTQNRSWKVLKKGGILVSIVAPPSAEEAAKHSVRSAFLSGHSSFPASLNAIVDAGKLECQTRKPSAHYVWQLPLPTRSNNRNQNPAFFSTFHERFWVSPPSVSSTTSTS